MSYVYELEQLLKEARNELGSINALTLHPNVHNGPGGDGLFRLLQKIDILLTNPYEAGRDSGANEMRSMAINLIRHISNEDGPGLGSKRMEAALASLKLSDNEPMMENT